MDAAELEHAFGAIFENTEHIKHVRNDHVIAAPLRVQNFSTREHAGDIAEPALQHFHVNSEREHVQSADLDFLPPMRRRFRIQIDAGETLEANIVWCPNEVFGEQFFNEQICTH